MLQNWLLECATHFHIPIQHNRIGQIINAQPGGETPIKRLAVDEVDGPMAVTRNQDVVVAHIPMNERKTISVSGSLDHASRMFSVEGSDQLRPARL
jgi:hypothetical protein